MILIKFVVLCFIVFLCASPLCELVVFDPGKWLYRTRSEGLTGYSCLSVLLPLRVRLGHLSWNNSGGSATVLFKKGTNRPKRWILRERGWWSTTTRRSPSSTSQGTTKSMTLARVKRRKMGRRRGTSGRLSTTTVTNLPLLKRTTNTRRKRKWLT